MNAHGADCTPTWKSHWRGTFASRLRTTAIALSTALLAACSQVHIPIPAVYAMRGGDLAQLPLEAWIADPIEVDMWWYEREISFEYANGELTLSTNTVGGGREVLSLLERGMALGMASQGLPVAPVPAPASPAAQPADGGLMDATSFAALNSALSDIATRLTALERSAPAPIELQPIEPETVP